MKKLIQKVMGKFGYAPIKNEQERCPDVKEAEFWEIFNLCKPYTMTSAERMYSLYKGVEYVLNHDIKGDFVECGVWRGGSAMFMAQMLSKRKVTDRKIFLYDTFEGMSEPSANDVDLSGRNAKKMMAEHEDNKETSVWCLADLADVQRNLGRTSIDASQVVYVKGKVEDTIPHQIPSGNIALLRLDTDWYESTKHELIHLYPQLSLNGVLIIDDYGHWEGCRKAVDEYFQEAKTSVLLNRIDYTGRIGLKTG